MAAEPVGDDRGLVALYAARMNGRSDTMTMRAETCHRAPAVHQFGRRPVVRVCRSRVRRAGAVSALAATALLVGTQAASAATTHQVQPGETLFSIAKRYQTTTDRLVQLNKLANPNLIIAGSTLTIEPDAPQPATGREYQVAAGDTLAKIAAKFGVTVGSIMEANSLPNANLIEVGTTLTIPALAPASTLPASTTPAAGSTPLHIVMPGETLSRIAKQYGVSVDTLAAANKLADPNYVESGTLLRIPGVAATDASGAVKLRGMPTLRQSLPLSCEAAALSIATAYWGNQVSEWVFIENMPSSPNPHLGFRGKMTGAFGGTGDYGVYAEPLVPLLNRYGFQGDMFYAEGNADLLKQQIDQGRPVIVWLTNMTSVQQRSYEWYQGQRFALVPQEHTVVVYGYDQDKVYVADPGDGTYRTFDWASFMRSWGYFDGMSLAVSPA